MSGAQHLLDHLGARRGDRVLVATSPDVSMGGAAVARVVDELRVCGADHVLRPTSEWIPVPGDLSGFDLIVILSVSKSPHRRRILDLLADAPACRARVVRVFGFGDTFLDVACGWTRASTKQLNHRLISLARSTRRMRVRSASGTELDIGLDRLVPWTSSCGEFDRAHPAVLPLGEVNTYSADVSGRFVVDGAINSSLGFVGDARCSDAPVSLEISAGRLVSWECKDIRRRAVLAALLSVPNGDRVGEVGIGTNLGIDRFVAECSHLNERRPGFHLGFGTPTQTVGVDWSSPGHVDMISADVEIFFGNRLVFSRGRFVGLDGTDVGNDSNESGHDGPSISYVDAL